jgi:hypothetical protein
MNVLHHTQKDLEAAKHTIELIKRDEVYLIISAFERGVGVADKGTKLLPKEGAEKNPTTFSYIISPFNSNNGDANNYVRNLRAISIPSPPMIVRDKYGFIDMTSVLPESKIYYTIDGTEPTQTSLKYFEPFEQISSAIIKAKSFIHGTMSLTTVAEVPQLQVLTPIISPVDVYFSDICHIKITSPMQDAELRYSLDGSEPVETSLLYKNPIEKRETSTILVRAFKKGHKPSEIISSKYEKVNLGKGVEYRYYIGKFESTPNYLNLTPDKIKNIDQFRLEDIENVSSHYALLLIGSIDIKIAGEYTFYSGSNDGTKLYIGDVLLIDNDGGHGYQEKYGKIKLDKGQHKIEVRYFQQGGGQELKISWQGPGFDKREMTKEDLSGG